MEKQVVGVVLLKDDKVLLVRHAKNKTHQADTYGLPAGHVEPGEEQIDAAMRELKEETGLDALAKDLIRLPVEYRATMKKRDGRDEAMVWRVFKCAKYSGTLQSSDETIPEWVEISRLDSLPLVLNVQNAIDQAIGSNA